MRASSDSATLVEYFITLLSATHHLLSCWNPKSAHKCYSGSTPKSKSGGQCNQVLLRALLVPCHLLLNHFYPQTVVAVKGYIFLSTRMLWSKSNRSGKTTVHAKGLYYTKGPHSFQACCLKIHILTQPRWSEFKYI